MAPKLGKTRIFNQLIGFVLPFVVGSILFTGIVLMWTHYRHFRATVARNYTTILRVSAGEIRFFLQYARKNLETLAWVLATGTPDLYDQEMALVAFNQVNGEFAGVSLVLPDGETVAATRWNDDLVAQQAPSRDPNSQIGQSRFSDIWFFERKLPLVSMSVPYPSFGRAPLSVTGVLNLKHVWDVLKGIDIGPGGYVFIMNTEGRCIAHRYMDRVLTSRKAMDQKIIAKIRGAEQPVSWFEKKNHGTEFCLGAYIPEMEWIVVLSQPTREIFRFLFYNAYWAATITAVACLLAVLLGWFQVKRFIRPIETMHRQVRRIGQGDLDHRVTVTSTSEIGELGEAFNEMTASLKVTIEREIRTATQLAHARNLAVLGVSASKVTHEVGNLLNNVGMSANALKGEALRPPGIAALAKMEAEAVRVRIFLQDFLKFAKSPALQPAPVALDLVIREVLAMHEPAIRERGIEGGLDWPPDAPQLQADARLLYQAFNNLVQNSIEALNGKGWIRINGKIDGPFLEINVVDNGCGIAPEHRERIFEPFFTTKGKAGNGLGMAIVRSIITAHRGGITCLSQVGRGTRFVIRLPIT